MQAVGGVTKLVVDGRRIDLESMGIINIGERLREVQVGLDGVQGYKEMGQAPKFEGVARVKDEWTLEELVKIAHSTAVCYLSSGKQYVLRCATYAAEGDFNPEDGTLPFTLVGDDMEEI